MGEVTHLKPQDIDSESMRIFIRNGKGEKDRYVMLSPRLLEDLRAYWKVCRPKDWLFPGQENAPISATTVQRVFARAKGKAGIDKAATPHSLPRRLTAEEFIRRFLQHVLPERFVRIRYFGMLANRHRRDQLERARDCLQASPPPPLAPPEESREEMLYRLTGDDPSRCPVCGQGRLRREREFPRDRSGRVSARGPP